MTPRFLFDEDLVGVGQIIAGARDDVWVIGKRGCPFKTGSPDESWIPKAADKRLVVIRRDTDLEKVDSPEYRLWTETKSRGFVLSIRNAELWDQLKVLVANWDRMENHIAARKESEGWAAKIRRGGITPIV